MTTRHDLPGGQWADLLDPDELTGADQDAFFDRYDELLAEVPLPAPRPDPANPAVMLPAPPRTVGRAGNRAMEDWLLAKVIKSWSFDLPIPYTRQYREVLPVRVCNALVKAAKPVQDALVDDEADEADSAPKSAEPSGTGGSPDTSRAGSPSPLPAPPAVTSGTP